MQLGIILTGVFAGIYGITTPMIMVSRWFPRTKGRIMGIVSAGVIISTVIILPVFSRLIAATNIVIAMAILGACLVIFGIINLFILKNSPEEYGLLPDNKEMTEEERERFASKEDPDITMREAMKKPRLWLMSIGWGLNLLSMIGFVFIAYSYLLERGVPGNIAMTAVGISGILSCAGSLFSGVVDQKIGPVKSALIICSVQLLGLMLVIFYHGASIAIVLLSYFIIMLAMGPSNSLSSSHNLSVFGVRNYSITFNFQTCITSIIKVMGTFIAARSISWFGDYSLAYKCFGIAAAIGLILILAAGERREE